MTGRTLLNGLSAGPPVLVDGACWVVIGVCGFLATQFGGDEAASLFNAAHIFWMKTINGSLLALASSLKMFRSTSYAEHRQTVDQQGMDVKKTSTTTEHVEVVKPANGKPEVHTETIAEVTKTSESTNDKTEKSPTNITLIKPG